MLSEAMNQTIDRALRSAGVGFCRVPVQTAPGVPDTGREILRQGRGRRANLGRPVAANRHCGEGRR